MATERPYRIGNEIHLFGNCGRQGNLDVSRLNFENDPVKNIKSGNGFMVLLYASGNVILIGDNEKGQLGCKDREPHDGPQKLAVPEEEHPINIGCGDRHVFMTTSANRLYAWGRNEMNQVGVEDQRVVLESTVINDMLDIIQMSGGCHHSVFLSESGRVFVIGLNNYGQLGLGPKVGPTVTRPISQITKAVQVACGAYHTAIILANGQLLTFGSNTVGQLGIPNSSKEIRHFLPVQVKLPSAAKQVVCGSMHTIVLTASGAVYGFGYNAFGQLGLGNFEDHFWTPQHIISVSQLKINEIRCGFNHTAFLTDNGELYICGWGQEGQLGLDSTVNRSLPTKVNHPSLEGRYVVGVSCGFSHTAAISISTQLIEQRKQQITINKEALSLQQYLVEKGSEELQNDLLLCPVCYDILKSPISQCFNGHVVCSQCKKQLSTCPMCRAHFSTVPNRILAEIISTLEKNKQENSNSSLDNSE